MERAATLEDIRAEVLAPDRLNTVVFGGFAAVALAIAVVGVAGVLAFSCQRPHPRIRHPPCDRIAAAALLAGVLTGGRHHGRLVWIAGAAGGFVLARVAGSYFPEMRMPDATPVVASVVVLLGAAFLASALPAARAARVDIIQALRSE